jgi:hypothetical protein
MDYMLDERDVQTTALENADHGLGTNGLLENLKLMVSGYAERLRVWAFRVFVGRPIILVTLPRPALSRN